MKTTVLDRVKYLIDSDYNSSASAFAKVIEIPQGTMSNYITGKSKVSLDLIQAILRNLPSISAEWLLRGDGDRILKENKSIFEKIASALPSCGDEDYYEAQLEEKDKEIRELKKENSQLKKIISDTK